jgi:prepilin-type N-terminal cleavage/methylation domain-containing protein
MDYLYNQKGFTLVELMVAMVISLFLLSGVGLIYSSISETTKSAKKIELNLEIIRFSHQIFTKALKQTSEFPTIVAQNQLTIKQSAGLYSCAGTKESSNFEEKYSVVDGFLVCEIAGVSIKLLKGVEVIKFALTNNLLNIELQADTLPDYLGGMISFDVALSSIILTNSFN